MLVKDAGDRYAKTSIGHFWLKMKQYQGFKTWIVDLHRVNSDRNYLTA
ncbi:MAG: hypothetical protein V7K48_20690 [Nostoc sp.]